MTVREFMDIIKDADPDDPIICRIPEWNPYSNDESVDISFREEDVTNDSYYGVVIDLLNY